MEMAAHGEQIELQHFADDIQPLVKQYTDRIVSMTKTAHGSIFAIDGILHFTTRLAE